MVGSIFNFDVKINLLHKNGLFFNHCHLVNFLNSVYYKTVIYQFIAYPLLYKNKYINK